MRTRAVISFLAVLLLTTVFGNARQQGTFQITGVVRDARGQAVPGATVQLLLRDGTRKETRRTDSSGSFLFLGLNAGAYAVNASRGDELSPEVFVTGTAGAIQRIDLNLTDGANHSSRIKSSQSGETADIQFSDVPNFTVAGVTDWTAAGGHGSDMSLRTSESLTREMLALKAGPNNPAIPVSAATGEDYLRKQLESSPRDLNANEELGRWYLNAERYSEALGPLQTVYDLDPTRKENEYELALALSRSGQPMKARGHVDRLLAAGDRPEWHRLAGEIDENLGEPLLALHAFELAVKEDPSEENYFAWGTELLRHRAIWQAKDVFESAIKAYPHSPRLLTALGTALFSAALYKESAERLCEASDLNPTNVEPYLFMGKVEIAAPDPLPCIETRLQRFVGLRPADALANYYYAMAYWKQHGKSTRPEVLDHVVQYLSQAVDTDAKCGSAFLQLGVIRASQSDFRQAAEYYRKAITADPLSSEAHYRLGVAYDRLGERAMAAEEFRLHDEIEKKQAAEVDRQRREVKQFLVQVGGDGENKSTQP